jgi:ribosome maturation factor RimP
MAPAPATVVELVRSVAARAAATYGLEIFDVQYRREAVGMVLRVQIDRPGPAATAEECVSVEDCARVSRDLSALLDVEDVVPSAYTLEVSSPGLDRPLRHADDYRRFAGRQAKLVVRQAVDGQTFFKGRLGGIEGTEVLIEAEGGRRHRVPIGAITRANLEVEF